jgi:hypothetical protein
MWSLIVAAAASTTAAASTPVAATTASAPAAFAHWSGLVHHQRPAHEFFAVAGLNRSLCRSVVRELGESKPPRLTGKFVANDLVGIGVNRRL